MITLLEQPTKQQMQEIAHFCAVSCLGVKAIGPLLSYGTDYPFATSWVQQNELGHLTAFCSKFYGTVTAYLAETARAADREELLSFLQMIGYQTLISTPDVTGTKETGCLMKLEKGEDCIAKESAEAVSFLENENLAEFYTLLQKNNPGYLGQDYEAWLVDFSHRIRHQTARSVLLMANQSACATAAALVVTEPAVFLGAISTNADCRGKHFASSNIRHLCNAYADKTIYLMCKPEKQCFYEKLGMIRVGTYAEKEN